MHRWWWIALGLTLASAAPAAAASTTYAIDPEASRVKVHVGKSGVFGFAGHEHDVLGKPSGGRVVADPANLSASRVSVQLQAASFKVVPDKEPKDAPKVQQAMEEQVLEVASHPAMAFESTAVSGREVSPGRYRLEVKGTLTLHGVSRSVSVPVDVEVKGDTLTATGRTSVSHRVFGMRRVSAGGGTVKVADEIEIDFTLVARAAR